ncbi:MAG TPA: nitrilase-related carbon-nitrogen hydrolase [Longimicrobiales bacterium]
MIGPNFRLAVHQFAPELRAVEANAARIAAAAARSGADLVLTPELSLTGYDVGDDAAALAVALDDGAAPAAALGAGPDLVVGLIDRGAGGVPYNAAVHLRGGAVWFRHRKRYLPTYGMFDEGRFFGHGDTVAAYDLGGGWRAGLLVCEDFWHPALVYLLAVQGIQLLLVQAAAPGRGAWSGGAEGGRFASSDAWVRIARTTAQLYGIYVALANRVGAEGGVVFAGDSLIVGPTGEVLARAPSDAETVIEAELSLDEVARARRPYAHARDEDPHFVRRELTRILEARP